MTTPNSMNLSGAARVLAAAAAFDKRTVGDADAIAWADALHHLDPADCIRAVADHYGRSSEYLMPSHIRVRVREIIRERQDRDATSRGLPTGPPASAATRAEVRDAVHQAVRRRQHVDTGASRSSRTDVDHDAGRGTAQPARPPSGENLENKIPADVAPAVGR